MIKITQKTVLATAVAGALGIVAGPAQAIEAKVSGHVNRTYMAADDGEDSESFFVDNQNSNTRFRFTGTGQLSPEVTAGIKFETELTTEQSDQVSIQDTDATVTGPGQNAEIDVRHADIYFQGEFGKVSLGKGDGSANNLNEIDISGSFIAGYQASQFVGGGIVFQDNGALGPSIGATYNHFDFESRYDRVRYDSPALGPVVLTGSLGTKSGNDVYDLAAWINSDIDGGHKLAAGVGFSNENVGGVADAQETFGVSASLLLANGWSVTGTVSQLEDDDPANPDADTIYTKVGYRSGQHAIGVNYGLTEDLAQKGDESDFVGLTYVFKPVAWAELYANGKVHSLDRDGADFDDISILALGARLKF